ncbi:BON1-associated protein 2 isoform X2 [Jatropha curcas]|uniref:BON1-associated protein 2 isoform X2 n=1 Tax=Jatropha curcas TaxID=180498 RepID=UPI001895BFBF|nr:BON1-associated protein 2 isoform X2 [Jatropha curcas]
MEITVISAQGLKSKSSGPFSHRLRPFITITTYPSTPFNGNKKCHVYSTRIDDQGGVNPTWGDKFHMPIDTAFLANRYNCICLELYTKRLIMGKVLLGWCQIPVTDIGFPPVNSVKHLSYRIRARDGTRGHGTVNLAIKLTGCQPVVGQRLISDSDNHHQKDSDTCETIKRGGKKETATVALIRCVWPWINKERWV